MLSSGSDPEIAASLTFFRSLKGAPASVLCVLGFTRTSMTNQELQRWTGYAHERITTALQVLRDLGWVKADSPRGPWSLAERPGISMLQVMANAAGTGDADTAPAAADAQANEEPQEVTVTTPDMVLASAAAEVDAAMTLVQSLKGAPASVLLALSTTRRAMTHRELELWTRCGSNQVTLALRTLGRLGWLSARSARGPWSLASRAGFPSPMCLKEANVFKRLNDDDESLNLVTEESSSSSNPRRRGLLKCMQECGIEEPTASELAALPHVTPSYVRAHVKAVRAKGLGVGAAIVRMRQAVPAPKPRDEARERSDEVAEQIRRFIEGEDA
jgi:predicted transcriptional regulator